MQDYWAEHNVYAYDPNSTKELYSIDTPPATVNGHLHIGHIFSYTQAEMIARYKRMQGFNVFYPFGFDDNGLPSERLVEKETGMLARDFVRSEFAKKCTETTQKYENEFKKMWSSMGFSCDWSKQYQTISPLSQKESQKSFLELAKNHHAYVKKSPVLWCTECQTSIAQAELDVNEVETFFNYLPFSVGDTTLEIATTRPELLYGVVCVFVNPEDSRYAHLVGKKAKVPLYNFEVPIMTDEKVAIDKGTGAVMCATFGDSTDAEWYEKYNLENKQVITADGKICDDVPFIAGLPVKAARKKIIELLKENNLIIKSEKLMHMVSTHERCGTETEIISSQQWYIDVLSKKQELLDAGEKIHWHPEAMKKRYIAWVENLKWDWCISRQRYNGVPIPVWYCADCGKPHFAAEEQLPVNPLETPYTGKCECGCTSFIPESAILDTWATSSITPLINKANEPSISLPMSMRTQAHEIIRTWAFYTIVKSLYHTGDIPWKDIMICGFVLAKPGEKISKSKSNSKISPQELISNYTADVIRYWAANPKLGTDTFFDIDELSIAKRFVTKLWNASKFAISNLSGYNPSMKPKELLPVDKWIIERTKQTIADAKKDLDNYEIGLARHTIDNLFWKDLCDNYIEIVKERLYKPEQFGEDQRCSGQYALYYCLLNILKMYSIYVPHITEYIYLKFFKQFENSVSIHQLLWETDLNYDVQYIEFGEELKNAIFEMRKIKSEQKLSVKDDMDLMVVSSTDAKADWFKKTEKDLIACSHAKQIDYRIMQ